MPGTALVPQLAGLFRETGEAHHQAYRHTNGHDPEWPLWYAGRLQDDLAGLTGNPVWKSELVDFLVLANKAQPTEAPGADWADFYARFFVKRYL
ncbi:MAG: hypothetical protein ACT4PY_05000 [Armatimonadota bacterium]